MKLPKVSAQSWAIVDGQGSLIFGKQENVKREIASLTKMMTCYVSVVLIKRFKLDPKKFLIPISKNAAS